MLCWMSPFVDNYYYLCLFPYIVCHCGCGQYGQRTDLCHQRGTL